MVILKPRASSSAPMDAAAIPFPRPETTPPVMKMYFVLMAQLSYARTDNVSVKVRFGGRERGWYAGRDECRVSTGLTNDDLRDHAGSFASSLSTRATSSGRSTPRWAFVVCNTAI